MIKSRNAIFIIASHDWLTYKLNIASVWLLRNVLIIIHDRSSWKIFENENLIIRLKLFENINPFLLKMFWFFYEIISGKVFHPELKRISSAWLGLRLNLDVQPRDSVDEDADVRTAVTTGCNPSPTLPATTSRWSQGNKTSNRRWRTPPSVPAALQSAPHWHCICSGAPPLQRRSGRCVERTGAPIESGWNVRIYGIGLWVDCRDHNKTKSSKKNHFNWIECGRQALN